MIDNVFADLENMFYLLSKLSTVTKWKMYENNMRPYDYRNACFYCINAFCCKITHLLINILRILSKLIIYPLIMCLSIVIILPSCFLLLIVRMNKVETTHKAMAIRDAIIEAEHCCKRFYR